MSVVRSDDVLGGRPRLEGTRISVLQVAELVVDAGESPETVADQLDISLADVHHALAYYYDNTEEMNDHRERQEELLDDLRERSKAPETVEQ